MVQEECFAVPDGAVKKSAMSVCHHRPSPGGYALLAALTLGCGGGSDIDGPGSRPDASTDAGADPDAPSCVPGSTEACYSGPAGTEHVGACKSGIRVCVPDGSGYGECLGQVTPLAETCATPVDDDCDGQVNEEGEDCACTPGEAAECYSGALDALGVGACKSGTQVCKPDGTGYGQCYGEVLPSPRARTCDLLSAPA
jgi:hypothetical protein